MDATGPFPTGDELLRHAQWIRRLAGALLRDEGAAEDLVQDTWVAALTHRRAGVRLRPWLRQVARNFAHQHHRGSARRLERERASRPAGELPGPEAFLERLEMEQRVTRALAELDEPFRSTLMLRYYEDLEPAEIAVRLGTPGGTVRWRLKRGLEALRARLDEAHDGDRRAWCSALLPLAHLDGAAAAGTGVAAVALPGLVLMNILKVAGAAAALLVIALGLSVAGVLPESLVPWEPRERPLEVGFRPLETAPVTGGAPLAAPLETLRTEAPRSAEPEEASAEPAARPAQLDARILGHGRPLAGAHLVVVAAGRRLEPVASAEDGSVRREFALGAEPELVTIEVHALGFASQAQEAVCAAGTTAHLGRIELAPGGVVSGRVTDERGLGLADCQVTLGSLEVPYPRLEALRLEPAFSDVPGCKTDASGRFRLGGAPVGMVRLWAHGGGRKAGYTPPLEVRENQESFGVELTLEPLPSINRVRGIVLDPGGSPVPGARLAFRQSSEASGTTMASEREADGAGRFEFVLPEDARLWLTASDPDGRWSPGSVSDLRTGGPEVVVQLALARLVELAVRSRDGGPVPRFGLEVLAPDDGPLLGRVEPAEHEGGRARFVLPTEVFVLRVTAAAHHLLELGPFDPHRMGETLQAVVDPVPGLHGIVLRENAPAAGVRVVLQAEVEADARVEKNGFRVQVHPEPLDEATTDAEGRFLLTARAAGSYFVRAEPAGGVPGEFGPFAVGPELAGPPIELPLGLGGAIEGRVILAAGASPEGSIVAITRGDGHARTLRVGADGRYRFDGLMAGAWRVDLHGEEILASRSSISSTRGRKVEPFELEANCTVLEGRTTHFDLEQGELLTFEGQLSLGGEPARGWSAQLGPSGKLEFEGDTWEPLDLEGRFRLRVREPGDYRLALARQGNPTRMQYLFDEVSVGPGGAPWELDVRMGVLVLAGIESWDGEGMPGVVHTWHGAGKLISLTTSLAVEGGQVRFDVPVGKSQLRVPRRSDDPEEWPILREVEVRGTGEARVELQPSDLRGSEEPEH